MPKSRPRCVTSLSSSSKVPSSRSNSMRSRAESLPSLCWRFWRSSPPPCSAAAWRRWSSWSLSMLLIVTGGQARVARRCWVLGGGLCGFVLNCSLGRIGVRDLFRTNEANKYCRINCFQKRRTQFAAGSVRNWAGVGMGWGLGREMAAAGTLAGCGDGGYRSGFGSGWCGDVHKISWWTRVKTGLYEGDQNIKLSKDIYEKKGEYEDNRDYENYDVYYRSEERRVGKECRSRWS